MAEYFEGRQSVTRGREQIGRRITVSYEVELWWRVLISDSVRCGATDTYSVKRKAGISKTHQELLEASLGGSIGPRDLAQLKSSISSRIGSTIKWDYEESEEYTIDYAAPECGEYKMRRYQLARDILLTIHDARWFSDASGSIRLSEVLPIYSDRSEVFPYDKRCDCREKGPGTRPYDGFIRYEAGRISGIIPFREVDGLVQVEYGGFRATLGSTVQGVFNLRLPLEMLPPDLRVLGELSGSYLDASCSISFRDTSSLFLMPTEASGASSVKLDTRLIIPIKSAKAPSAPQDSAKRTSSDLLSDD